MHVPELNNSTVLIKNPQLNAILGGVMSTEALGKYLQPVNLVLDQIFLDPNNPRFTGSDWESVSDTEINNAEVQEATRKKLIAEYEIHKLQASMEINGYLPVDRIAVRKFADDQYVIL